MKLSNEKREEIIEKELDTIYKGFNLGLIKISREKLKGLRYLADDFEEVANGVSKKILESTDLTEEDSGYYDILQFTIYAYYNLLNITYVTLEEEDFGDLGEESFKRMWGNIKVKDKIYLIDTYLGTEDMMILVYGMHLLISQVVDK